MATEELVNETYSVSPQTWNERTLFGGVRLNSRIFLFVFFLWEIFLKALNLVKRFYLDWEHL